MKINAKQVLVNFKGQALKGPDKEDFTLGNAVANILLAHKVGGKMKLYGLSEKFFKEDEVEVDMADLALIKQAVEACDTTMYTNMITGQVLTLLEAAK